jgi:hypothetical protein
MASRSAAPNRAFALGSSTGTFPAATEWLSFVNSSGSLTITTPGGDKIVLSLPTGMYPIRATAVTGYRGFQRQQYRWLVVVKAGRRARVVQCHR